MQVKVGPKFFRNELKDYSDWVFAYVREIMQNGIDAGSKIIDVKVELADGNTVLTVTNDGSVMSLDIILNKLLALGESGKDMVTSVGGFGKAKILLYMAQESYEICSGSIKVVGCGGDFDILDNDVFVNGVISKVVICGDLMDRFIDAFRTIADYSKWGGKLIVNGEQFKLNLNCGRYRRDLTCGCVYTNKSFKNRVVVRVGGLVTAIYRPVYDGCIVIELNNSSYLTSNRDGLQYVYRLELDGFISDTSVNKRRAFAPPVAKVEVFSGSKLFSKVGGKADVDVAPEIKGEARKVIVKDGVTWGEVLNAFDAGINFNTRDIPSAAAVKDRSLGFEFVLRNECDLKVPKHYHPDHFSKYSSSLISIWAKLMVKLHDVFKCSRFFNVGFVFSKSCEALRVENSGDVTYFINPVELIRTDATTSIKNRFQLTERNRLLSIALHEFVHEFISGHDENFASLITDYMGIVIDRRKEFNECFKV